jgi:flavin reductase (DIM6/NTAB) family NADH-FMN oxidoreductase RutF
MKIKQIRRLAMKRNVTIIGIFAILLLAGAVLVLFSEENNQVKMEKAGKYLEKVITETGKKDEGSNPGYMKKSLGARIILPCTPVWVIGSYDKEGKPNVMTAAWVGICCSKPPAVSISLRKATYTYGNIMERKAFTVNIPSEQFAEETAYFGSVSGRDVDKFSTTGLTPVRSDLVDAPYIKEFPLAIECKLIKIVEVGLHTMFIGEIVDVKANESILGEDGLPDMKKLKPFVFAVGSFSFYRTGNSLGKVPSLAKEATKR